MSPPRGVRFRQATEADIPGQHRVFVVAESELLERHGFAWASTPPVEAVAGTLGHLLRHDAERCFVAVVDDRVVGYSGAWIRGEASFLAALFIDPAHQGAGVGRHLMELALDGAPAWQMTISDSIQPISNALYARHGMFPMTPILRFQGRAAVKAPAGVEPSAPTPEGLALIDRAAYGFDRAVDHAYWATVATPTLWTRAGEPIAYAYRWSFGRLGPLAGRDEASAALALQAELARGPEATLNIPGTARPLVRAALTAGLRIEAPPGLLLVSEGHEPPRSLAICSYGLM
jgi:GNAT superfamily N-acetyltransferase